MAVALGEHGDDLRPAAAPLCPLLGVKRTCLLHCICLLLTQSGHCAT